MKKSYSIRTILGLLALILAVIMAVGLYYIQDRQQNTLIRQAAENRYELVGRFLADMDDSFDVVESYLYNALYGNADVETLIHNEDEVERYYAKERIADILEQVVRLNDYVESVWFYSPGWDEEFLSRNDYTGITLQELLNMQEILTSLLQDPSGNKYLMSDRWEWITVNEREYLLWMMPVGTSCCGVWVSSSYLFGLLEDWLQAEEVTELLLCSVDGDILEQTGEMEASLTGQDISWAEYGNRYINICNYSENADIAVELYVPKELFLSGSPEVDYAWVFLLLLGFVALAAVLFQVLIFTPFQKLIREMEIVGTGNAKAYIHVNVHFKEARDLGTSINRLLEERQELSRQVYEAELTQRDIQCQYLQIRLKTHFYMNCLSIIHAMARTGHTDLIQELAYCLVKYLRFVKDDSEKFVRMEEELEHVRNYARIQELRFPELFEYREDVAMELYDASIPPLVLQTFIENSVEHGMRHGEKNWIRVEARYTEEGGMPNIHFIIQDNGKGFSEEELEMFKSDPAHLDLFRNHGIGIRNVIGRLWLLYGGKAKIRFSNRTEGGAQIEFWLPLLDVEEEAV